MKKLIIFFILILITGCGDSSDTKDEQVNPYVDDYYEFMWNINPNSIYQKNSIVKEGADINITKAWEKTYGEGIKVAVIDDCFDVNHMDLKDNILKAYDINNNSTNVLGYECHGTEVAGVIGALKNSYGIVGVAPKVQLILIKINLENSYESDFVRAFEYAKAQGAKVINCSWGSNDEGELLADELKQIKDAGIITVFASGNEGINMDLRGINDESEDPNVIGVGATEGETNDVTPYSNFGKNIDILAPGGSEDLGLIVLGDHDEYYEEAGTSFSSPTVAGVIALMLSLDSSLDFDMVYSRITKTAQKVGIENGARYIDGFDIRRAYGKIDASSAVYDDKE